MGRYQNGKNCSLSRNWLDFGPYFLEKSHAFSKLAIIFFKSLSCVYLCSIIPFPFGTVSSIYKPLKWLINAIQGLDFRFVICICLRLYLPKLFCCFTMIYFSRFSATTIWPPWNHRFPRTSQLSSLRTKTQKEREKSLDVERKEKEKNSWEWTVGESGGFRRARTRNLDPKRLWSPKNR